MTDPCCHLLMQVQHPEDLEESLGDLQRRAQELAEEAAQAEQLRDGQQSLLAANQRLSRQVAELQRGSKGELPVFWTGMSICVVMYSWCCKTQNSGEDCECGLHGIHDECCSTIVLAPNQMDRSCWQVV